MLRIVIFIFLSLLKYMYKYFNIEIEFPRIMIYDNIKSSPVN